jgi:hypothetical protein
MSAFDVVSRLAAMDREELLFRVRCEARKAIGRLRFTVSPPRFNRSRIARVLDPAAGPLIASAIAASRRGDALAAHADLARHFQTRVSRWPLQAARRQQLIDEIHRACPRAAAAARRQADRIVAGHVHLLGFRDVAVGNPPDWHADAIHGRRAPLKHWTRVPYLDPACGDHKIIWETNRHQYLLELGTAHWLTGDPLYRDTAIAHVRDWIAANPPFAGVNWASMLELAFRTMSWTWMVEFFCQDAEADRAPWLVDLLVSLDTQLAHVQENLSTYFSPNTHISGEALALYAVSRAFPELRRSPARAASGRAILIAEAARQVRPDGGHAELSSHYHRYSTDFYLLALMVARAAGEDAAETFETAARRQAGFLRTIADDRGNLPQLGDDDGGRLFRFDDEPPSNAAVTLGVSSTVLADPALAVAPPRVAEYWIVGASPAPAGRRSPVAPWPSRLLRDSGYFVSRTADGSHLVFDVGPHGFLNGGHAHADALSIVLGIEGQPIFVDSGTGTYTLDAEARDRFRSSRMHNTLVLAGREHAIPDGPFHWRTRADARLLIARATPGMDFAAGLHDGYAPYRHVRAVLAIQGAGWLIVDRVTGPGPVAADTWWHLHPSWSASVADRCVELHGPQERHVTCAFTTPDVSLVADDRGFSPVYGLIERGVAIKASHAAEDRWILASFVAAHAAGERVEIVDRTAGASGGTWVESRFAIQVGESHRRVSIWLPDDEVEAEPARWPQPCIEQLQMSCAE